MDNEKRSEERRTVLFSLAFKIKSRKRESRLYRLRVRHRKKRGGLDERYLIRSNHQKMSIAVFPIDDGLEIGGIFASRSEWRRVLLPLLAEPEQDQPAQNL